VSHCGTSTLAVRPHRIHAGETGAVQSVITGSIMIAMSGTSPKVDLLDVNTGSVEGIGFLCMMSKKKMEGAKLLQCSEFGREIINNM